MDFIKKAFQKKCVHCDQPMDREARFCPHCGLAQENATRPCGQCGKSYAATAKFCPYCGSPAGAQDRPALTNNRWARQPGDFAARVEVQDLAGLMNRELVVEPGTQAWLVVDGQSQGILPPGTHTLDDLQQRLMRLASGAGRPNINALLTDVNPVELTYTFDDLFTRDPLSLRVSVTVLVELANPAKFGLHLMRERRNFTQRDLQAYLYPDVQQATAEWARTQPMDALMNNLNLKTLYETHLLTSLADTLTRVGLRFYAPNDALTHVLPVRAVSFHYVHYASQQKRLEAVRVRELEMQLEAEERDLARRQATLAQTEADRQAQDKAQRAWQARQAELRQAQANLNVDTEFFALQLSRAEAERQRDKLLAESHHARRLDELAAETRAVEHQEARLSVLSRMRRAVLSDKLDELKTTAELDAFLRAQNQQNLLADKELDDLKRSWLEARQDHDLERAHLLLRLETIRNHELTVLRLHQQQALTQQQVDFEMALARKKADFEYEQRRHQVDEALALEREKHRQAVERAQLEADIADLKRRQRQQDFQGEVDEAKAGWDILMHMKQTNLELAAKEQALARLDLEERKRIDREDQLARDRAKLEDDLRRFEAEEHRRAAERQFDLDKRAQLATLPTTAILALSTPDQARLIVELQRDEAFRTMSEEQILAALAANSPEAARALAAKYQATAQSAQADQRDLLALYERWLAAAQRDQDQARAEADRRVRDQQEAQESQAALAKHALDRLSETAQAFARATPNQAPIIIPPAGSTPPVMMTTGTPTGQPATRLCPNCGVTNPYANAFCAECGYKFPGGRA